jgi:hypothetical protein
MVWRRKKRKKKRKWSFIEKQTQKERRIGTTSKGIKLFPE